MLSLEFSINIILPAALMSTQSLTEMSTKNISWGGKDGRCVGLTTLPPSCAACLEIWKYPPPGTLRGLYRPVMGLLYLYLNIKPVPRSEHIPSLLQYLVSTTKVAPCGTNTKHVNTLRRHNVEFVVTVAKLRKMTIRFVMSVCPSVSPRETTRLQLDGFS